TKTPLASSPRRISRQARTSKKRRATAPSNEQRARTRLTALRDGCCRLSRNPAGEGGGAAADRGDAETAAGAARGQGRRKSRHQNRGGKVDHAAEAAGDLRTGAHITRDRSRPRRQRGQSLRDRSEERCAAKRLLADGKSERGF